MKKEKVRLGLVGFGRRGRLMTKNIFAEMKDVEIAVFCESYEPALLEAKEILQKKGHTETVYTTEYEDVLADPSVDAVVLMTPWFGRIEMAIRAMRAGKYTALEVGSAYTLKQCFDLVEAYEETGVPVMLMENCCYGRPEMMALNLREMGLWGELVHCEGAYGHFLLKDELLANNEVGRHYRLHEYIYRSCDQYSTHELGPILKLLHLNRGNRMLTLSSFASKSAGIREYIRDHIGEDSEYAKADYKQADIVSTNIKCAGGETIHICLDTTLPRGYYSRNFQVRGTKGAYFEDRHFLNVPGLDPALKHSNNEEEVFPLYDHPLWKEYVAKGEKEGHGGMDWLVGRAFVEAVKNGTDTPISAYDSALLLAIGPLTEMSIARGGAPVDVPDFTNGKWTRPAAPVEGKYCLDKVCTDESIEVY